MMERITVLLTTMMIVTIAASKNRAGDSVCQTESCKLAAQNILDSMNKTVDPCQDFYQFVCGGFIEKNRLTSTETRKSFFSKLGDHLDQQVKDIMSEPKNNGDSNIIKKMKADFAACKDEAQVEKDGYNFHMEQFVNNQFGGWQIIIGDEFDQSKYNFGKLDGYNIRSGIFTPMMYSEVVEDFNDPSRHTIEIEQATFLYLAREMYLAPNKYQEEFKAVKTLIRDLITLFAKKANKNVEDATLNKFIDEVIAFETKVAKLMKPWSFLNNGTAIYNPYTLGTFDSTWPSLKANDYFEAMFKDTSITVTSNTSVTVTNPEYYDGFNKLIKNTTAIFLSNYQVLKKANDFGNVGPKALRDIQFKYDEVIEGLPAQDDRPTSCMLWSAATASKFVIASAYLQKYFQTSAKDEAQKIVDLVKSNFKASLNESDTLDAAAKTVAMEKLDWLVVKLASPEWLSTKEKVDKYYEDFPYNSNKGYLDSLYQTIRWENKKKLEKLPEKVDRNEWTKTPARIGLKYDPYRNTLTIPAGTLQSPVITPGAPKYLHFGTLGHAVGANIAKAFDNRGIHYGKTGNLQDWIKPETMIKIDSKKHCFIDLYNSIEIPELKRRLGSKAHVNGKKTLFRNMGDFAGLVYSFKAYQEYAKDHSDPKLPGLEKYSNDKLFFISSARTQCQVTTKEELYYEVLYSSKTPGPYRVFGVFSNNEDFRKTFQCANDTPYNRNEICPLP